MNTRPTSVTVIAWLLIVFGLLGVLGSFALVVNPSNPLLLDLLGESKLSLLETMMMGWIAALARLACGLGLFYRQNGARYLLVAYGFAAIAYGAYASGNLLTTILGGLIFTVLAIFLFLPKANTWFAEKSARPEIA